MDGGEAQGHRARNPRAVALPAAELRAETVRGRGGLGGLPALSSRLLVRGACADQPCVFAALNLGLMLRLESTKPHGAGRHTPVFIFSLVSSFRTFVFVFLLNGH